MACKPHLLLTSQEGEDVAGRLVVMDTHYCVDGRAHVVRDGLLCVHDIDWKRPGFG